MGHPHLVAVCVGRPQELATPKRTVLTAIGKAVAEGPVAARGVNLEGDDQADRTVHGGPHKAVYAYAREDTAFWEDVLGRDLGPGGFGENLWLSGVDCTGAKPGERWRIGTALFEVSEPRLPCFKLGLKLGDPTLVRRFGQAGRPGAYLRIVEEGVVQAGDAVEVVSVPDDHEVTMALLSRWALGEHDLSAEVLTAAPHLSEAWRDHAEQLLASG